MAIGFEIRKRRERKNDDGAMQSNGHANGIGPDSEQSDERTSLLAAGQ